MSLLLLFHGAAGGEVDEPIVGRVPIRIVQPDPRLEYLLRDDEDALIALSLIDPL